MHSHGVMQKYACKYTALQCFGGFMAALMKVIVSCSFLVLVLDVCFVLVIVFLVLSLVLFLVLLFLTMKPNRFISLWLC